MLRASAAAERAGVHSVSIVGAGFTAMANAIARMLGLADMALAEYPGTIMTDSDGEFERKVREVIVPSVVEGLARSATSLAVDSDDSWRESVFSGDLLQVHDHFHSRAWTDGLPIIPPTRDAVSAFLANTVREPDEVLGTLLPANADATVWSVAVNGVMAGCRPEYMPVLVAVVEAICDPVFRLRDAGSTPGWEPLIIVSGPIIQELDFNFGTGIFRVGARANTTVGRFLRLYMRNAAGLRPPPGGNTDKATFGTNFNVVLAEDEATARACGWETFGVDERGGASGASLVTVMSVQGTTPPIYSSGSSAPSHLKKIGEIYGAMAAHWTCAGLRHGEYHGLLVVSPVIARVLAADGIAKADIRDYLHRECTMPLDVVKRYATDTSGKKLDFDYLSSHYPELQPYADAKDGDPVAIFPWPEMLAIVVAGDANRNQSRGFVNNQTQGSPVSRTVEARPNSARASVRM